MLPSKSRDIDSSGTPLVSGTLFRQASVFVLEVFCLQRRFLGFLPENCVDGHNDATNTEEEECAVGDAVEHDRSDSGDYAVEGPLAHQC